MQVYRTKEMRTLLLMRGAMGSGKSTFIRENQLEQYTLEADKIRMMVSAPELKPNGNFAISQKHDTFVWDLLLQLLEDRMKRGDFTVIDATHSAAHLTKKYIELADKYKYSCFYYQLDTDLDTCLHNNMERAKKDPHKFVPEDAIKRCHSLIQSTSLPNRFKRIHALSEIDNFYTLDLTNKYKNIKVIGDIQGCYSVLSEALNLSNQPELDKDTMYIFTGDLLDRGIENKQVFDWFLSVYRQPNVMVVEGNHEAHLFTYSNLGIEYCHSEEFVKNTYPQILGNIKAGTKQEAEFKSQIRSLYKTMVQCVKLKFHEQEFFICHGGLYSVPKLMYVSTRDLIRGSGKYETDIVDIYENNYHNGLCQGLIQVHGHRKQKESNISICLEDSVEFGGNLCVLDISANGYSVQKYKNSVFSAEAVEKQKHKDDTQYMNKVDDKDLTAKEEINDMLRSKLVNVKSIPFSEQRKIYSLNFSNRAFYDKKWNSMTIKARGLFVDSVTGEVLIRSYEKFFNFKELPQTTEQQLRENLVFPVKAWHKYNGFLGIMSVIDGKTQLATKSTIAGDFKNMFQELWDKVPHEITEFMANLAQKHNVSFIFEVVHRNDVHIVEYPKEQLVLLDVLPNTLHLPHNWDVTSKELMLFVQNYIHDFSIQNDILSFKQLLGLANNYEELEQIMDDLDKTEIEGGVFQDSNNFMFKYKAKFYSFWKTCRFLTNIASGLIHNNSGFVDAFPFAKCHSDKQIVYATWLMQKINSDEAFKFMIKNNQWNIVQLRKMFLHDNQ